MWRPWDSLKCCYTCTMTKRIMNGLKRNAWAKPTWRGYTEKGTENKMGSMTASLNEFTAVFIMLEQCALKCIKLLWFHLFSIFGLYLWWCLFFPGRILFFSVFVLASGGPSLGRTPPFAGGRVGEKNICVEHRVLIFICYPACFINTIKWKNK